MERLVFYGKGGIGKSTISANVSATLSSLNQRVLHVGCDPKHDSTVSLMGGEMIATVLDTGSQGAVAKEDLVGVSDSGVHCVEAGGPQAGVGCAGRGISSTVEIMRNAGLLDDGSYDVIVYDLLGDVVCGGFAAPLRQDVGEKVVIVSSEEVMSLYAANNVARAIVTYASNGIVCAGMLLNLRDPDEDLGPVTRFAELLNVPILGVLRREPLIREAEYERTTVVQLAPEAPVSELFRKLARTIVEKRPEDCVVPTPVNDRDFYALARNKFDATAAGYSPRKAMRMLQPVEPPPPVQTTAADPEDDETDYARDLAASVDAVRRGLVPADVALDRLQSVYPSFAERLDVSDLR